jgi:hypothetical protein
MQDMYTLILNWSKIIIIVPLYVVPCERHFLVWSNEYEVCDTGKDGFN